MSFCPKCRREFVEQGFCPYDGNALTADDGPTFDQELATDADIATIDERYRTASLDEPVMAQLGHKDVSLKDATPELLRRLVARAESEYERLIGTELDGRYRIERKIGEGGMGVVFLASHIVIEKPVAIKVLKREVASDRSVVQRFVQEARAASRIGHPNIIDVTDFGTTADGMTYQVMEYIEGQTLAGLLKESPTLSIPRALGISAQIARALAAAHEKGIVHRDLKPENIFLIEREQRPDFVKIVDFGIAKVQPVAGSEHEPRLTRVGTIFGTPEYMSPEQAAGRTDVDERADIYALGIMLYEMLTGRVPLKGDTAVRTLAMQMLDVPKSLREVNPSLEISVGLEAAILRALAKDREDRYRSMTEFLQGLEDVTSTNELNLPLLVSQERASTEHSSAPGGLDFAENTDSVHTAQWNEPSTASGVARRAAVYEDSEANRPSRRRGRATDPAFVGQRALPVFDEIDPGTDNGPAPRRSSIFGVLAALFLLGGGVGGYFLWKGSRAPADGAVAAATHDASTARIDQPADDRVADKVMLIDAGAVAEETGEVVARNADGGITGTSPDKRIEVARAENTRTEIKRPERTGGTSQPTLPKTNSPEQTIKREIEVTVSTHPKGGQLYNGKSYAGVDGLNIRRDEGTVLKLRCSLEGYKDGEVTVAFDGKNEIFLCKMKDSGDDCIDELHNPFNSKCKNP